MYKGKKSERIHIVVNWMYLKKVKNAKGGIRLESKIGPRTSDILRNQLRI